jgi:hypothetical protein
MLSKSLFRKTAAAFIAVATISATTLTANATMKNYVNSGKARCESVFHNTDMGEQHLMYCMIIGKEFIMAKGHSSS